MTIAIIIVEFADPDLIPNDILVTEMQRIRVTTPIANIAMHSLANYWSAQRWNNQIMRVHRYNSNLPALRPANINRPY